MVNNFSCVSPDEMSYEMCQGRGVCLRSDAPRGSKKRNPLSHQTNDFETGAFSYATRDEFSITVVFYCMRQDRRGRLSQRAESERSRENTQDERRRTCQSQRTS